MTYTTDKILLKLEHVLNVQGQCIQCKQKYRLTKECPVIETSVNSRKLIDDNKIDYTRGEWVISPDYEGNHNLLQLELDRLNRRLVNTIVDINLSTKPQSTVYTQ